MRETLRVSGTIIFGCIILSACASNEPTIPPPAPAAATAAPAPMRRVAEAPVAPRQTPAAPAGIVPGSLRDFQVNVGDRVFFSFDSSNLDDAARQTLAKEAIWLKRFPGVDVTIQGNCDERGTREYNLALGARRAEAVKEYLTVAGINTSRLTTISFGKEQPVCAESTEACWAQNRRAVSVIKETAPPNIAMR
jgi:peptidoglycan-associated lipoprotein